MRLRNLSTRKIPRDLWSRLAVLMGVGDALPGAQADDVGMYGRCKTLRVTIRPVRNVPSGTETIAGSHTYGHISIAPCRHCTIGALTHVYLHELVHAWLFQLHESLYGSWNHCAFAERFADAAFATLTGDFRHREQCGSHKLNVASARRNLPRFAVLAQSLIATDRARIRGWQPRSPARPRVSLQANTLNPSVLRVTARAQSDKRRATCGLAARRSNE